MSRDLNNNYETASDRRRMLASHRLSDGLQLLPTTTTNFLSPCNEDVMDQEVHVVLRQ